MRRQILILTLILILMSVMTFAQVELDSTQYVMVRKNKNHQSWIYLGKIGPNRDTVLTGHTAPGSYTLLTGKLLYRFTLNKNGLLNDSVFQIRQNPANGDRTIMLVRESMITKTQYFQNQNLSSEILSMPQSQIIRSFSNGKLTNSMEMQLVNGQALYITTVYYSNGNKYQVNDQVNNVDSFFHENGKPKEIKYHSTESLKKFNQNGILVSHVYRVELKDQIPAYSMYEDEFEGKRLVRRHIRTYDNQVTILRYRNAKVYEKEVVTVRDNGWEEIVEIYNPQEKKTREFTRNRGRQEVKQEKPTIDNR